MTGRVVVVGAAGQLGTDLVRLLGADACGLTHAQLDVTLRDSIAATLEAATPRCVINCAAYNLVDAAEAEPERAFAINAFGPRFIAQWCAAREVPLLHVSTDFVFGLDATRRVPWTTDDPPGPISAYGTSKLAGEQFVRAIAPRHWVVRTCGLYGPRPTRGKGNFVETMLRLATERPELRVVHDQHCTPTSTADLAAAIVALIQTEAYGLYHVTNAGATTWHDFAAEIFRLADLHPRLLPITSAEFGAPARRPVYSVLDCGRYESATGLSLRPWQAALQEYLARR